MPNPQPEYRPTWPDPNPGDQPPLLSDLNVDLGWEIRGGLRRISYLSITPPGPEIVKAGQFAAQCLADFGKQVVELSDLIKAAWPVELLSAGLDLASGTDRTAVVIVPPSRRRAKKNRNL